MISSYPSGAGRQATSGSNYVEVSTGSVGNEFFIDFSGLVAAFGVYGIDVGDFGSQLTMSFYNGGGLSAPGLPPMASVVTTTARTMAT